MLSSLEIALKKIKLMMFEGHMHSLSKPDNNWEVSPSGIDSAYCGKYLVP